MNLDESLFKKALKIQNFDNEVIKVTDKTIEFLESIGLSSETIEFFKTFSFREEIEFGNVYFNCVNRIRTENLEEENKEIYKNHLLIIGSGLNGDPIVLNTKTLNVGYIFHDILWEEDNIEDLNKIYIDLKMSVGTFFYKSISKEDFPVDAYEAEDYIK
ncbi:hypothetical protein SAMN02927916_0822 [Flavobacterium anhuiense]|uniref:SMI1/KNR4 family protein n=1 Tax=Flavobacterium anhuiense TaxID=459526 RepID=A0ABY0LAF8_9FLAO|nr:hypothetical protein [Flavobacterium anhuiense]SCX93388.1 hypothetical protein SAMN02927916_0822 [Flavobacterium anhuiense]